MALEQARRRACEEALQDTREELGMANAYIEDLKSEIARHHALIEKLRDQAQTLLDVIRQNGHDVYDTDHSGPCRKDVQLDLAMSELRRTLNREVG